MIDGCLRRFSPVMIDGCAPEPHAHMCIRLSDEHPQGKPQRTVMQCKHDIDRAFRTQASIIHSECGTVTNLAERGNENPPNDAQPPRLSS
jgi:hypothetical protein